jgi:hypothetical protein
MKNSTAVIVILITLKCMGQEVKPKNFHQADKKLADLMVFGLDHGIESVKASVKGPLVPFTMTETNEERKLNRIITEKLEEGLTEGMKSLEADDVSRYGIIVYDGYLTIEGRRFDAVIVKGFDRNDSLGYSIGQRYQLKKFLTPFRTIGSPVFIGNQEQILK